MDPAQGILAISRLFFGLGWRLSAHCVPSTRTRHYTWGGYDARIWNGGMGCRANDAQGIADGYAVARRQSRYSQRT